MSEKTYSLEMTIRSLLGNKRYSTIKDILITLNAADIAAIFAELEPDMLPLLFRLLPKELAADTFVEMDPDQQELLIVRFSDTELKEVIDELYIDDAVDLVEEMPANVVKRILGQHNSYLYYGYRFKAQLAAERGVPLVAKDYMHMALKYMDVPESYLAGLNQAFNQQHENASWILNTIDHATPNPDSLHWDI